jgi:hypothetical protein
LFDISCFVLLALHILAPFLPLRYLCVVDLNFLFGGGTPAINADTGTAFIALINKVNFLVGASVLSPKYHISLVHTRASFTPTALVSEA